jgi:hypothetical protein
LTVFVRRRCFCHHRHKGCRHFYYHYDIQPYRFEEPIGLSGVRGLYTRKRTGDIVDHASVMLADKEYCSQACRSRVYRRRLSQQRQQRQWHLLGLARSQGQLRDRDTMVLREHQPRAHSRSKAAN